MTTYVYDTETSFDYPVSNTSDALENSDDGVYYSAEIENPVACTVKTAERLLKIMAKKARKEYADEYDFGPEYFNLSAEKLSAVINAIAEPYKFKVKKGKITKYKRHEDGTLSITSFTGENAAIEAEQYQFPEENKLTGE